MIDEGVLAGAMAALARGEKEAMAVIYDAAGRELYGLALWRTRNADDAADVVQEVFLRLAQTGVPLGDIARPKAYLLGMAHRAAVDVLRTRRRTAPLDDTLLLDGGTGSGEQLAAQRGLRGRGPARPRTARGRLFAPLLRPLLLRNREGPGNFIVHGRQPSPAGAEQIEKDDGSTVMTNSHPLDPFRPPEPPDELRARALRAAQRAPRTATIAPPPKHVFGPWDWAWAAALVLAILANLLLGGSRPTGTGRDMAATPISAYDAELSALGIPDDVIAGPPARNPGTMDQDRNHSIEGL